LYYYVDKVIKAGHFKKWPMKENMHGGIVDALIKQ